MPRRAVGRGEGKATLITSGKVRGFQVKLQTITGDLYDWSFYTDNKYTGN